MCVGGVCATQWVCGGERTICGVQISPHHVRVRHVRLGALPTEPSCQALFLKVHLLMDGHCVWYNRRLRSVYSTQTLSGSQTHAL